MFPAEIWVKILDELRWRELVPLRQVCQQFDHLICDQLRRRPGVREYVFYALFQKVAVLTVEQLRWALKTFQYGRLDFWLKSPCFLEEVVRWNRRDLLTLILEETINHDDPPTFTLPDLSKFCDRRTVDGLGLFLWGIEHDAADCCDFLQSHLHLAVSSALIFKSAILKRSKKVIFWLKRHTYVGLGSLLLYWQSDSVCDTKELLLHFIDESSKDKVQQIISELYDFQSVHYNVVSVLLQLGYRLPIYCQQLCLMAERGDLKSLKVLHRRGVKIRSRQDVCKAAFQSGNVDLIKWITKKKWANPFKDTSSQVVLMKYLIVKKKLEAVQYLKQTWKLELTDRESQINILATGSASICRLFPIESSLVLDRWELNSVLHSCAAVASKQFIDTYLDLHTPYLEPCWYVEQLLDQLIHNDDGLSFAMTKWLLEKSYDPSTKTFGGYHFMGVLQMMSSHSKHAEQVCKLLIEGYVNLTARDVRFNEDQNQESLFMVAVPLSVLQYMIRVFEPTRQLLLKVYLQYCVALKIDIVMWLKEEYNF